MPVDVCLKPAAQTHAEPSAEAVTPVPVQALQAGAPAFEDWPAGHTPLQAAVVRPEVLP